MYKIIKLIFLIPLFLISTFVSAAPTPEQMQLLNQLSPEQKTIALESFKQKQGNSPSSSPIVQTETVKPRAVETSEKIEEIIEKGTDKPSLKEGQQEKQVHQKLKQFGYDLFAGTPTTFAPATDIPVPFDYVVGPGDTVRVQLFGKENSEYELSVTRDGQLNFPNIGPIAVVGLSFQELKTNLHRRISKQMIGVKANITMGVLRSIRIFILGDAERPGSYTVSALSTMTNALFVSGGIKPIGSLRDIQLKRKGKIVTHLDLYDLLMHGDTSADTRLQPGDVIFISPIKATIGIAGEIRRPAIYELNEEKSIRDIMLFSGGLLPTAYPQTAQLERINKNGERNIIDVDLLKESGLNYRLRDGDVLKVYSISERMEDIVLLSGHAQRPGGYQWRNDMTLTDVIPSIKDLLPRPDLRYIVIKREKELDRSIETIIAQLDKAWSNPKSTHNSILRPRDEIIIFGQDQHRSEKLIPIIDQLKQQSRYDQPELIVTIQGNVRYPGVYPLANEMRLSDLVIACYDILPKTDLNYSLIIREINSGDRLQVVSVRLDKALYIPGSELDPRLEPKDIVYVFSLEEKRQQQIEHVLEQLNSQARFDEPAEVVSINGLIVSPGLYPLEKGMRIRDLIFAGGGLKEAAYSLKSEITRYQILEKNIRATEHIDVDLEQVLAGNEDANVLLMAHDNLHIKQLPEWIQQHYVEITGEVRFPGTYPIKKGEKLGTIIRRAGGLTKFAYMDGAIFMRKELQEKEQKQIDGMINRLEMDIEVTSLSEGEITTMKSLLTQLKQAKPVGRLVIDLETILDDDEDKTDVILHSHDKLFVPTYSQEVTIIGEVHYPTSHLFDEDKSRDDYINLSGGVTYKADEDRIYIVRSNGAVVSSKSGWFGKQNIVAGDTIVVPLEADRIRPLTFITEITQVLYQLGIAAASWKALGVF